MLYAVLAAWLTGMVVTAMAIRYARGRLLMDQPGDRRSHDAPTPRGGGIGIVAGVVAVGLGLLVRDGMDGGGQAGLLGAFLLGFTIVAAVGWMDDHRPLPASLRLLVHVVAASLFAAGLWPATGGHPGLVLAGFLAPLVLTNVWNFMDGINGIAATQAIAVAVFLSLTLDGPWTMLALAMAAATWAFLPFNFPRARVFMGDVGSGAIGYALGCLLAVAAWNPLAAAHVLAPTLLLALPISAFFVDAALTLAQRILRGERWWTPHVQHAYQAGARAWGHGRVTLGYLGWTVVACVVAVATWSQSDFFACSIVLGWYTLGALLWWRLQRWTRARELAVRSRNSA